MRVIFYWIFVYIILKGFVSKLAFKIKRDCIFGVGRRILSRRKDFIQVGPKKTQNYNPNYGYEPYWPGGDWVFQRLETTTPKRGGFICGNECPELYIEFGEVCGRNINYTHKTFENYCALLNEDCTGREKWLIAYRGNCSGDLKTYPTKYIHLVTRAEQYIRDFEAGVAPKKHYKG